MDVILIGILTVLGITCYFSILIFPAAAQRWDIVPVPNDTLRYENPAYGIEVMYQSTWKIEGKDFRGGDYVTNIVAFRPPFDAKEKSNTIEGRQLIHLESFICLNFTA